MKKTHQLVFASFALFSLIACGNARQSNENPSSEKPSIDTSVVQPSSNQSSVDILITSKPTSSSEKSSSSSIISSSEQKSSSTQGSSSEQPSSSEVPSSSSSSGESTSQVDEVTYHVRFVNYDETLLYEVDVLEGEDAVYVGETPEKEGDDEFNYEFDGWDIELTNISSNTTAVAQYKAVAKENWGPIIWF